jgi:hypothetical protein
MRSTNAVRAVVVCGSVMLVACQDGGVTAPKDVVNPQFAALSASGCGAEATRNALAGGAQSTGFGLPMVTVWATFTGGGLPFGLVQAMNFPRGPSLIRPECLNDGNVQYSVTDAPAIADPGPIPPPEGVDPQWWAGLSAREQMVLVEWANKILEAGGSGQYTIGSVINNFFGDDIRKARHDARLRGNDLFPGRPKEAAQFGGACYACMLYQYFTANPKWPFSNAQTLRLVVALVAGFAESQFALEPLRGVQFARNGAYGVGLAAEDGYRSECGAFILQAVWSGTIVVTDPYEVRGPGRVNPVVPPELDQ